MSPQGGMYMGGVILLILTLICLGVLWSFPLYLCGNLVLALFGVAYRITIPQAFAVCLLANVLSNLLFNKGEK